jgi:hypothetical protein
MKPGKSVLARNEQLKALAAMFHNLAAALIAASVAAPMIAYATAEHPPIAVLAAAPFGLLLASGCIVLGQRILADLSE